MAGFLYYRAKQIKMGNLLYIIAVILVIGWLIGFLGFHAGSLIHILLVVAIIAVLIRIIRGASRFSDQLPEPSKPGEIHIHTGL